MRNNFKVSFFNKLRMNFGGGYLADQYVLYDLKNNDKREYLSEFDWYKSRYINEPFDFAFNNKVICNEILKQYVRVPYIFFIKNKGFVFNNQSKIANVDNVIECLKQNNKLILKPISLGQGNGIHLLEYSHQELKIDGQIQTSRELQKMLCKSNNYMICEYMEQHSYAKHLYDNTANTIRVLAVKSTDSIGFKLLHAVQRIGTSQTIPVDNASKGAIISKIDLEKGTLSPGRCLHDLDTYYFHPDSNVKIDEIRIPNWNEIKKELIELSNKFPYMSLIAWDILIQDDKWCVIEANTSSGINILQLWGGIKKSELGSFLADNGIFKTKELY